MPRGRPKKSVPPVYPSGAPSSEAPEPVPAAAADKAKPGRKPAGEKKPNGAALGFEEKLWSAADKMRNNMDAAEYKHVVLGLIFLKYISDAFAERHGWLLSEAANPKSDYFVKEPKARYGVAEDRDEYTAESVFWVPKEARWDFIRDNAKQPDIGRRLDFRDLVAVDVLLVAGEIQHPRTRRAERMADGKQHRIAQAAADQRNRFVSGDFGR